ncbi:MAG: hypothetical protein NWE75_02550 [Candidatus Bathyarchaeota archaeon]|nr:hypothetical protein [Candidatus Bathyarchaeota archaeon]
MEDSFRACYLKDVLHRFRQLKSLAEKERWSLSVRNLFRSSLIRPQSRSAVGSE